MLKYTKYLLCFYVFLLVFMISVHSSVSSVSYKVVFSEPSSLVIEEQKRIVSLFRELSYGVDKNSIFEIVELSKEQFLGEVAKDVEFKDKKLILYLDKKGKMSIEGIFSEACEKKIIKKSWLVETFGK